MPNRPLLDERMNDPPACDKNSIRHFWFQGVSGPFKTSRDKNEKPRLKPGLTYLGLFGP